MFLRKLLGNENKNGPKADHKTGPPAGMQAMGATLQRRFAKGIQYNMKIVIKGDRNVGKSNLFHRLQGHKFREEYIPTDEIQVTSIQWNYKATDDIVKVEVWDVVDKGKKKKKVDGLKLDTANDGPTDSWAINPHLNDSTTVGDMVYDDPCLDAEFVDVYKGTHGVIMMLDITKQWTYDYIERELIKVPNHMPILVLANHRDMGHHRTVTEEQIRLFLEETSQQRPEGSAQIRYAEASMRNGFGLKYIHKFFNLPFLQLQRETLLRQLETNSREIKTTVHELNIHEESDEQNYDLFLEGITSRRRETQEVLARSALDDAQTKQELDARAAEAALAAVTTQSAPTTPSNPHPPSIPGKLREAPPAKPIPGLQLNTLPVSIPAPSPSPEPFPEPFTAAKSAPSTPASTPQVEQKSGFMSRIFGRKPEKVMKQSASTGMLDMECGAMPVRTVEDFVPEEGLDANFLEDTKDTKDIKLSKATTANDDSDSDAGGNPMVSGFQDDLDSEDEIDIPIKTNHSLPSHNVHLSSEEEDVKVEDETMNSMVMVDQDIDFSEDEHTHTVTLQPELSSRSSSQNSKPKSRSSAVSRGQVSGSHSQQNSIDLAYKASSDNIDSLSDLSPTIEEKLLPPSDNAQVRSPPGHNSTRSFRAGEGDEGEESEEEQGPVVLQGVEDISEDELQPHTKSVQKNTSKEKEPINPPSLSLQFEDLSILERGIDSNTGLAREESVSSELAASSRADTDTDADSKAMKKKKKHKHKDKEKDKDEERTHRKKHKKHRDTDGDEEKKGKKKKKKDGDIVGGLKSKTVLKEMDDLEAFLGSPGDGAYETL